MLMTERSQSLELEKMKIKQQSMEQFLENAKKVDINAL